MYRRGLILPLILTVTALSVTPVEAEQKTRLRWKFSENDQFTYVMDQNMAQQMNFAGQNMKTSAKTRFDISWSITDVQGDVANVVQTIDRIRMTMDSAGFELKYDSSDEEQQIDGPLAIMSQMFESLVGAKFRFKMNPRGEISDAEIPQELVEALGETPGAAQMGAMFDAENLKQLVGESSGMPLLPEGAIEQGQSWESEREMKNPVLGQQKISMAYTYEGPETVDRQKLDKIDFSGDIEFDSEGVDNPLGAEINVKDQSMDGSLLFDSEAGRLDRSEVTMKMKIDVEVNGQQIDQNIAITTTMRLVGDDEVDNDSTDNDSNGHE